MPPLTSIHSHFSFPPPRSERQQDSREEIPDSCPNSSLEHADHASMRMAWDLRGQFKEYCELKRKASNRKLILKLLRCQTIQQTCF
jgi:hypothetical protein